MSTVLKQKHSFSTYVWMFESGGFFETKDVSTQVDLEPSDMECIYIYDCIHFSGKLGLSPL